VNGHIAEGAQGECGRSEGVHWGARLRAQAVAQRPDFLCLCFRLSQANSSSLPWYLWIGADG